MMRPSDVVGFTYRADVICGECIVERMVHAGIAGPAAHDMPLADVIRQCSEAQGIALDGAYSPRDFPLPLSRADVARDRCASCGERLADVPALELPKGAQ